MATSSMLKAKGLQVFANYLQAIPEGSLFRADNINIDRDGVIEPRRGIKVIANLPEITKQLLNYKNRILAHYGNAIGYLSTTDPATVTVFQGKNDVTMKSGQDVINLTFHGFTTADTIQFSIINPPSGVISTGVDYYVVDIVNENQFKIANNPSGAPIVFDVDINATIVYDYVFQEVVPNLRVKAIEMNSSFYVTTKDGIKKIASLDPFFVSDAGGINALDVELSLDVGPGSSTSGFFGPLSSNPSDKDVEVAYFVVWGTKDVNNVLILGKPSSRSVITNTTGEYRNVKVEFSVPDRITQDYFFQIYRTATALIGGSGAEAKLVYEAPFKINATTANDGYEFDPISNSILVVDQQPNDLRDAGVPLYTNEFSGEGILQANDRPPVAQDIAIYKNCAFYANTRTAYKQELTFLGFDGVETFDIVGPIVVTLGEATLTTSSPHSINVGDYFALAGTDADGQYIAKPGTTGTTIVFDVSAASITQGDGGGQIGKSHLIISNSDDSLIRRYFIVGRQETWELNVLNKASTADGSYFNLTSADDKIPYTFWIKKNANTIAPSVPDRVAIEVDLTTLKTVQELAFTTPPTTGDYVLEYNGNSTDPLTYNTNSADLETELKTLLGLEEIAVSGSYTDGFTLEYAGEFLITISSDTTDGTLTIVTENNDIEVAEKIKDVLDSTFDFLVVQSNENLRISTINSGKVTDPDSGTVSVIPAFGGSFDPAEHIDGFGENAALGFFRLSSSISPAIRIDDSARSLVAVINFDRSSQVEAYYLSTGTNSLPGAFYLEAKQISLSPFKIKANNQTFGQMFNPDLSSEIVAENNQEGNALYFSKVQQPEAVPVVNKINIGPRDKSILRIIGLRDSLFVLKEEGAYRLTGENPTNFQVALFDNSADLIAPDTAVVLNNQIYCLTSQGVATIDETGVGVASRPIENLLNQVTSPLYPNFSYVSFGVSYEADRSYLLFVGENPTDVAATKAYRFNTFTNSWTSWIKDANCGVVEDSTNKLYLGAPDIPAVEVERKTLTSRDYADRQYNRFISTVQFDNIYVDSAQNMQPGDMLVQTQYLSVPDYNKLVKKLKFDPFISANSDIQNLTTITSNNTSLVQKMIDLVVALNSADPSETYVYDGSSDFQSIQTQYNVIVNTLNNSSGIFFADYALSVGTVYFDLLIVSVNKSLNTVRIMNTPPFILGPVVHYKSIKSEVVWAPISLGDPSISKHIREGTFLIETTSLAGAEVGYATDLSGNFENIPFLLDGDGGFGDSIYQNVAWGGEGVAYPIRTLIPRQKQRCRYIKAQFKHQNAFYKFSILGISYTFEMMSERAWR